MHNFLLNISYIFVISYNPRDLGTPMAAKVSVERDMFEDEVFVLAGSRSTSDNLPAFSEHCWEFSLSRENSEKLILSRQNSMSRQNSASVVVKDEKDEMLILSRENSGSLIEDLLVFGRQNSGLHMSRENSGFLGSLARETSADLGRLLCITSSISDVLGDTEETSSDEVKTHAAQSPPQENMCTRPCEELLELVGQLDTCPRIPKASRGKGTPRDSLRGAHVRGRPEMQKTARDGAAHWAAQVRVMRAAWAERAARRPAFADEYSGQICASQGRIKSKQECLLRFLQLAADDGVVVPGPFGGGGFFGWARFTVAGGRSGDFRRGLEGLFPAGFREDTLKETFRRAGLIPERFRWEEGWRGAVAFEFRPK